MARGVWAGIKMGAQAAQRATNGRMASSAPNQSTLALAEGEVESRSLDDSSVLDDSTTSVDTPSPSSTRDAESSSSRKQGGEWIKMIDICNFRTIAHFRLPASRHSVPSVPTRSRRVSEAGHTAVSHLAFSPDGTTLFATPVDGRSFHLFDVHPHTPSEHQVCEAEQVQGEVWHMYELRRGNTASEVVEVKWSDDGRWIGTATGRGTVRKLQLCRTGFRLISRCLRYQPLWWSAQRCYPYLAPSYQSQSLEFTLYYYRAVSSTSYATTGPKSKSPQYRYDFHVPSPAPRSTTTRDLLSRIGNIQIVITASRPRQTIYLPFNRCLLNSAVYKTSQERKWLD